MKKILSFFLALVLLLTCVPLTPVYATEAEDPHVHLEEPAAEETAPAETSAPIEETEPVVETETVTETTEPATEETQPVTEETEPVTEETYPSDLTAAAADGAVSEGLKYRIESDNTVTITGYDGAEPELVIPEEIEGKPVRKILPQAFVGCSVLSAVSLNDGLLTIGYGAFRECENLQSVVIPDTVTTIEYDAFNACASLEFIEIPDSVTNIERGAFSGSGLKSVRLSENLQVIASGLFRDCSQLEGIKIPNSVTKIETGAFQNCVKLNKFVIPDSVVTVDDIFRNCTGLQEVKIGAGVTSFGGFMNCTFLRKVVIAGNIKNDYIYTSFAHNCPNLEVIEFEDTATEIPTRMFEACESIKVVSISTGMQRINSHAFSACKQLWHVLYAGTEEQWNAIEMGTNEEMEKAVIHYNADPSAIHPVDITTCSYRALLECGICGDYYCDPTFEGLHTFENGVCIICGESEVGQKNERDGLRYLVGEDSVTILEYNGTNENLEIPAQIDGRPVVEIVSKAFYRNKTIRSVSVPGTVKHIGDSAFFESTVNTISLQEGVETIGVQAFACSSLQSISLPRTLKSIGKSAFGHCAAMRDIYITDISHFLSITKDRESSLLVAMWNYSCDAYLYLNGELLTELVIPADVTSIHEKAFCGCVSITSVVIPENVTNIDRQAFLGCSNLKTVSISENVQSIGGDAFHGCSAISTINLPKLETWLKVSFGGGLSSPIAASSVPKKVYFDGELLTELKIPQEITEIPDKAFYFCNELVSIELPGTVQVFGENAFAGTNIQSLTIPQGIIEISDYAFNNCKALVDLKLPNTLQTIGNYAFAGTGIQSLKIPQGTAVISTHAFSGCADLVDLELSGSVQTIGSNAFKGTGVQNVVIPEGVVNLNSYAFSHCTSLTSVSLPASLEKMGEHVFNACDQLSNFYLSDISTLFCALSSRGHIMLTNNLDKNLYLDGELITDLVIPDEMSEIPEKAFYRVRHLNSVFIPDSVEYIHDSAFAYCTNLRTVSVGYGVSIIDSKTFAWCINLDGLFLPDTIKKVYMDAFYRCKKLDCIVYAGTPEQLQKISVATGNDALYNAGWHCEGSCCQTTVSVVKDPVTNKPTLSWEDAPCVLAWGVYRSTSAEKGYELLDVVYDTTYTDLTNPGGKKYYYIVGGISLMGVLGSASKQKSIQVPCAAPNVGISNNSSGYPVLKWDKMTGAKNYEIWYAVEENGTFSKLTTTSSTSYTHSKAVPGTGYYYKVKAIGSSSSLNSQFSEPVYGFRKLAVPSITIAVNDDAGTAKISWEKVTGAIGYELQHKVNGGELESLGVITGTSYTHEGLVVGNAYTYRVNAISEIAEATSDYTIWETVFVKCGKPVLTIESDETGKPVLIWEAVDSAAEYEIQMATSSKGTYQQLAVITDTRYTHAEAVAGKTYYYKVRAIDAAGNAGDFCSYKSATAKCEAPANVEVTNNASGYPVIKWEKVDVAKKYEVYYSETEDGTYKKLTTTSSASYTHSKAASGKGYFYKVCAYGASTASTGAFSEVVYGVRKLAVPSITVTTNNDAGTAKITWKKITGAKSYALQCSINGGEFEKVEVINGTSYTYAGMKVGNSYIFRLRALCDNEDAFSEYSAEKAAFVKCAKPVLTASNEEAGKPVLSWEAIDGAAEYEIQMATSSKGKYKQLAIVTDPGFVHADAARAKTYYYKVRAIDANGNAGALSSYKSATCKCEAPVITEVTTNNSGYPMIKWEKVEGAKKYEVWYSTTEDGTYKKLTTTSSASYTYSKAKMDTEYYFKVRAYGSSTASLSDYSETVCGIRKLAQPSISLTTSQSNRKVTIKWKKVTNAKSYELQVSINGGEFKTIFTDNKLSYVHENLAPGNKYTYRLRAISEDDRVSSDYCAEKSATIKVGKPTLTITLSESGKPKLTWEAVEGAVEYQIYYATSKSGKYKLVETTEELSFIYEEAKAGKTCYFKVRAVDVNGTTGDYSSIKSIKSK